MEKEISEVKIYSKSLRKCIWNKGRASSKNVREQRGATEVSDYIVVFIEWMQLRGSGEHFSFSW